MCTFNCKLACELYHIKELWHYKERKVGKDDEGKVLWLVYGKQVFRMLLRMVPFSAESLVSSMVFNP